MRKLILIVLALLIVAVFWLMVTDSVKAAGYSYYPSYSYYSYPTYSYNYTPVYKEIPYYKEYPIYKEVTIPKYAVVPLYSIYYTPPQNPPQQQASTPCNGHAANVPSAASNPTNAPTPAMGNGTDACAATKAKLDRVEAQMELLLRIMGQGGSAPPPGAAATPKSPPPSKGKTPTPPKAPVPLPPEKLPKEPKGKEKGKEPTSEELSQKDIIQKGVNALYVGCVKCHESKVSDVEGGKFTIFNGTNVANLSQRQWKKIGDEISDDKMPPKKDSKGNPVPPLQKTQRDEILAMVAIARSQTAAE